MLLLLHGRSHLHPCRGRSSCLLHLQLQEHGCEAAEVLLLLEAPC